MNGAPLVSVGMPVHNGGRHVGAAIDSILQQSLGDLELIVSDNASTDSTPGIVQARASQDRRVRYVRNERNIGVTPNYCRVFELSRGRYFKWASSNDLVERSYLEKCVETMEHDPGVVLCFTRTALFSDDVGSARPYAEDLNIVDADAVQRFDQVLARIGLNNAVNGVIRSDVLRRTAVIPDYFSSDVLLIAELSLHGKIRQLDETLFYRRMSPDSATKMKPRAELFGTYYVSKSLATRFPGIRQTYGYWAAASRAPLSAHDRWRMLHRVARRAYWEAQHLVRWLLAFVGVGRKLD